MLRILWITCCKNIMHFFFQKWCKKILNISLNNNKISNLFIYLFSEHSPSTTLNLVGLQVWRGALLLADFILSNHNLVKDKVIVELGSGTGLASFITAMYAKTVICTGLLQLDIYNLLIKLLITSSTEFVLFCYFRKLRVLKKK